MKSGNKNRFEEFSQRASSMTDDDLLDSIVETFKTFGAIIYRLKEISDSDDSATQEEAEKLKAERNSRGGYLMAQVFEVIERMERKTPPEDNGKSYWDIMYGLESAARGLGHAWAKRNFGTLPEREQAAALVIVRQSEVELSLGLIREKLGIIKKQG